MKSTDIIILRISDCFRSPVFLFFGNLGIPRDLVPFEVGDHDLEEAVQISGVTSLSEGDVTHYVYVSKYVVFIKLNRVILHKDRLLTGIWITGQSEDGHPQLVYDARFAHCFYELVVVQGLLLVFTCLFLC